MRDIIGHRLKKLRTESHMTQENLANILNISREAYSLYETNKRQMNYETICSVSRFYNVSTDYILGNSESKKNYDLCNDEIDLLNLYRSCDQRGKRIILGVAKLSNSQKI